MSKVPLKRLPSDRLQRLNEAIAAGRVHDAGGQLVDTPLTEALITESETVIYRIDDGIPILLGERGIPKSQLDSV